MNQEIRRAKLIKINDAYMLDPFVDPKIDAQDYIGKIGDCELVAEDDIFAVTFDDGMVGNFVEDELEFLQD